MTAPDTAALKSRPKIIERVLKTRGAPRGKYAGNDSKLSPRAERVTPPLGDGPGR